MSRAPSPPPNITGFTHLDHLGSGGYADVFLYEQQSPKAQVAVKVLAGGDIEGGAQAFRAEADIMASVSHHPYIVQVFQAGIADDGRPYFVMDYYSGPNFSDRSRNEKLSVAEVLRVGVQLASAVETAHRAGILHRDIKPANVLTNRYMMPGLADFGIASPAGQTSVPEGMSVPWAPPESFGDSFKPDVRYDVYSLAATVYTMLAGRSPFEIPGGDNSHFALMQRIEHDPVPPIGRQDVPPSLEQVLRVALTKDRERRTATAADLGRQFNQIENELKLGQTPLVLEGAPQVSRARTDEVDEEATRIKGVQEIQAQAPPPARPGLIDGVGTTPSGSQLAPRRREGLLGEAVPTGATVPRGGGEVLPGDLDGASELADGASFSRLPLIAAATGVVILLVVAVALFGGGGEGSGDGDQQVDDSFGVNDGLDIEFATPPPAVEELTVTAGADGSFTATWVAPADGLRFVVTPDDGVAMEPTAETSVGVSTSCVVVESLDEDGLFSTGIRGCAE